MWYLSRGRWISIKDTATERFFDMYLDGFIMESTIWGRDVEGAPCQWAMDQFLCRVPPRYKGCESAGDANKLNRPRNGFIESHSELLTGNKESAANIPWDRMSIV